MDNNCFEDINMEAVADVTVQNERDCLRDRDVRGEYGTKPHIHDNDQVLGDRGADSSLLFFFLLLVVLVCQWDIDIDMDTLLWFFLLLVVIYREF